MAFSWDTRFPVKYNINQEKPGFIRDLEAVFYDKSSINSISAK